LRSRLEADGKTAFDVDVTLAGGTGQPIATMTVAWRVKKTG
jgi:hypothetical protein